MLLILVFRAETTGLLHQPRGALATQGGNCRLTTRARREVVIRCFLSQTDLIPNVKQLNEETAIKMLKQLNTF